jgi:hypothetical protein
MDYHNVLKIIRHTPLGKTFEMLAVVVTFNSLVSSLQNPAQATPKDVTPNKLKQEMAEKGKSSRERAGQETHNENLHYPKPELPNHNDTYRQIAPINAAMQMLPDSNVNQTLPVKPRNKSVFRA